MKQLTPVEQKVFNLWGTHTRNEIAEKLRVRGDYITRTARAIERKGHPIDIKPRSPSDSELILESVKRTQQHFAKVGEGDTFNHGIEKTFKAIGFTDLKTYNNRVRSLMTKLRVEGTYTDYIRGKVPGHRYIGIMPATLLRQRWTRELKL